MNELNFYLQPKQLLAINSQANEILYGGAAGGGKSHLIRVFSIWLCLNVPGIQVYIFRRKLKDLVKNHLDGPSGFRAMLNSLVQSGQCKINEIKKEIKIGSSRIFLCHCATESCKFEFQGYEMHAIFFDELTHFTQSIYDYLKSRARISGIHIPDFLKNRLPLIFSASNPGGIGHNWVKSSFVSISAPFEISKMSDADGGMLRQYIPARLEDNQILVKSDPFYESKLMGLGNNNLIKSLRNGDWDIISGGMFDDLWDYDKHVISPFEIPKSWYCDRSFDWGSSKPYSVGFWAESDGTTAKMKDGSTRTFPAGTLFRINEIYGWTGKPDDGLKESTTQISSKIFEIERNLNFKINPGPADASIYDTQNKNSIAKSFLKNGVEWTPANKAPGTRVLGWNLIRQMMLNTIQNNDSPHFYVFNNCIQFVRTFPVLPRSLKNNDDVDTGSEDHIADETRYRVLNEKQQIKINKIRRGI
jgi:Terminase large subunit, T4likevirus-type, N-terminal